MSSCLFARVQMCLRRTPVSPAR